LKALYNRKPVLEQAGHFGASEDEVLRLIGEVEKKVRIVLGRAAKIREVSSSGDPRA